MSLKWISAPSDCSAIRPRFRLPLVPSFTFLPFTFSVTSPPLQVISYWFHSPNGFSTFSSLLIAEVVAAFLVLRVLAGLVDLQRRQLPLLVGDQPEVPGLAGGELGLDRVRPHLVRAW